MHSTFINSKRIKGYDENGQKTYGDDVDGEISLLERRNGKNSAPVQITMQSNNTLCNLHITPCQGPTCRIFCLFAC